MVMKAKCGHIEEITYSDAHHGLCRKCHSNFAFLLELEQKYGEDALIEYWYAKILTYSPSERKEQDIRCFIDHLIEFYQRNLIEVPSKQKYIKKMLFMLHSIQKPFNIETLR
jgi:arginine/lysine/ornithine decarboxylase